VRSNDGEDLTTGTDLYVQALLDRGVVDATILAGKGTGPFHEACQRAGLCLSDFEQAGVAKPNAIGASPSALGEESSCTLPFTATATTRTP
jgi:hypothetical protein